MCWQWTGCSCYLSGWGEVTLLCSSLYFAVLCFVAKTPYSDTIHVFCLLLNSTCTVSRLSLPPPHPPPKARRLEGMGCHKFCLSLNFGWGEWAKGRVPAWLLARGNPGQQFLTHPTWQWTRATYKMEILWAASCFDLLCLPNIDISFVVCSWLCLRKSLRQTRGIWQLAGTVLAIFVFVSLMSESLLAGGIEWCCWIFQSCSCHC